MSNNQSTPGECRPLLNVLFLGGARRVAFAQKLKAAAAHRGAECRLFSFESDPCVAIASEATVLTGGRFGDAATLDELAAIIDRYKINVVLPFVDPAIEVASKLKALKPEVYIPVSSPEVAAMTFDKVLTDERLEAAGLPRPERITNFGEAEFPVIFKPRRGSASKGIQVVYTREAAHHKALIGNANYLAQSYIKNTCELTVDCFIDADGEVKACVPRTRLEVVGGEAVKTMTVYAPQAVALAKEVIAECGLQGAVTIQLICDCDIQPSQREWLVMEINARLGGGVVASINAGADIPGLIVDSALGRPAEMQSYEPNVMTARYLADVVIPIDTESDENTDNC